MKVGLLSYNLKSNHSGQTRFLVNIALGLKSTGHTPVVYSLYIDEPISEKLSKYSIKFVTSGKTQPTFANFRYMTYSDKPARELFDLIEKNDGNDVYVVLADEAIPVVNLLKEYKTAYISNGDLTLLLLNPKFKKHNKFATSILEKGFVKQIRKHANMVSKFDRVMGNSLFTSSVMAFFYDIPIDKVVYPPVDQSIFERIELSEPEDNFALALVRNDVDPLFSIVSRLSEKIPIKVVGGGRVENAQNLGFVSEDDLVKLYNNAIFTISPNVVEFYGYSIVESMSCGTPSLAYNNAGARELIHDGQNGWLFSSQTELIEESEALFKRGYDNSIRRNCLSESNKYGIPESTKSLISVIKDI